jgi:hypothetical protein
VVSAGLPVGSTAGTIQMMPHLRNIKELEQPRGQPTEQTKPTQTTRKGWGGGADERRSAATPKVKAAPLVAPRIGPVTTCGGKTVAQSDCGRRRRVGSNHPAACGTSLWLDPRYWRPSCTHVFQFAVKNGEAEYQHLPHAATQRKAIRGAKGVKGTKELTKERHRPTPQNDRHRAPPPAGGMPMPRLKPHRVPYDVRGGRWAMPLEAWQPGRTVVAGCVRVSWVRRSRTQSSDRDFLRMAIGSAG